MSAKPRTLEIDSQWEPEPFRVKTVVQPDWVKLEMSPSTLQRLMSKGELCAEEIRCLDCRARDCIWKLCLKSLGNSLKKSGHCK